MSEAINQAFKDGARLGEIREFLKTGVSDMNPMYRTEMVDYILGEARKIAKKYPSNSTASSYLDSIEKSATSIN